VSVEPVLPAVIRPMAALFWVLTVVPYDSSGGVASRYAAAPCGSGNSADVVAVFYHCVAFVRPGNAAGKRLSDNCARVIAVLYRSVAEFVNDNKNKKGGSLLKCEAF